MRKEEIFQQLESIYVPKSDGKQSKLCKPVVVIVVMEKRCGKKR